MKKFLALVVVVVIAGALWGAYQALSPYAGFNEPVILEIERGMSTRQIAAQLRRSGVLRAEWPFLAVRAARPKMVLQAGEYRFARAASPWEVYHRIARGDVHYYEVTIPEGSNLFDIGAILEREGLMTSDAFRKAASDASLISDLTPDAPSLEGYLFPSTYRVTRSVTPEKMAREMTDQFRKAWKSLGGRGDVHKIVTLASLVEKETGVAEERPVVASVFFNRLERGISLDCDPTTIYAALLEGRFRGTIYRSDLNSTHPYNTYRNPGLPPGPIANPGIESLRATLHPADTEYLYFVAQPGGNGRHAFSKDLAAHERAVAEYRRGKKSEPERPAERGSRAAESKPRR